MYFCTLYAQKRLGETPKKINKKPNQNTLSKDLKHINKQHIKQQQLSNISTTNQRKTLIKKFLHFNEKHTE